MPLHIGGGDLSEQEDWAVCIWANSAVTEHPPENTETLLWHFVTLLHPLSFPSKDIQPRWVLEGNQPLILPVQRSFPVRVIILHYWVLHNSIHLETGRKKRWRKDLHLIRNRSPDPLWEPGWEPGCEPELLEPEELPLPGLGTSFSTLSHSRRGSILL